MCEFCVKHGEGKKWYLNVKNYADDLLNDITRRKLVINHFYWIDKTYKKYTKVIHSLPLDVPVVGSVLRTIIRRFFISQKWAQIVPIEDVEAILNITNSITRVPCTCRWIKSGKEYRTCFLISLDPRKMGIAEIVDQSYFGGPDVAKFEKLKKEQALNLMKENEKKEQIHTVWAINAPFIGAICNCDFKTGCIPLEWQKVSMPVFFKAEFIAEVDKDKCKGCKACMEICPFGAIKFDSTIKKAIIDYRICYGCGICRTACQYCAMFLKDRNNVPEAATLW